MENRFSFGTHSYDFKGIEERFYGNLLILENKATVLIKNYEFQERLTIICVEDAFLTLENVRNVKVEMYDNSRIDIDGKNNELDIELNGKSHTSLIISRQTKRCNIKAFENSCIHTSNAVNLDNFKVELYDNAQWQTDI